MGGRQPANAALRGGALIVLAVVIGVALLAWGFAEEGGLVDAGDTTTSTTDPTDTTEDPDPTGTTDTTADDTDPEDLLPPARTREEITFLVMNASGVDGAAGRVRDRLNNLNYIPRSPETAPERAEDTTIYYIEGYRPEALRMAEDLNIAEPAGVVAEMPDPVPMGADLGESTSILVILGEDGLIAAAAG